MKQLLERAAIAASVLLVCSLNAVIFTGSALAQTAPPTCPPPAPKVTAMAAARFLQQAGFGPNSTSVCEVQTLGFSAWIDAQIAIPSSQWSVIPNYTIDLNGNATLAPTQQGFFVNAVNGDDQLRQRTALALSEILVVSRVKLIPQAVVPYLKLLQSDAFATYDKLLYDVTLSPAMGHYLDMVNNDNGPSPDENYAREVLQLFSIGLYNLDTYGNVLKDANGNAIPAYTQSTVEGFASLFTGWTYGVNAGVTPKWTDPANWLVPMVAIESHHSTSPKVLLNGYTTPANQTAELDLQDGLNNIFTHPNVGPFICRQLIQRLVTSSPSPGYVHRITGVFNSAPRGNMAAVIKAILLDPEARTGDLGAENLSTKLREPILWMSAFLRGLNATVGSPNNLPVKGANLGQEIYAPATVFSYFHPGYQISTGGQQHNAPEFELLSDATSASAADLAGIFAYFPANAGVTIDLSSYITPLGPAPTAAQINALVTSLNTALMGGRMPTYMFNAIVTAVTAEKTPTAIVQTAVYLIGSSWNYQVER